MVAFSFSRNTLDQVPQTLLDKWLFSYYYFIHEMFIFYCLQYEYEKAYTMVVRPQTSDAC